MNIILGKDFDFNFYQRFFHKWYWYAVDKNLSKLGVISKNRKTILDHKSFSYNAVEDVDYVDVFKCFSDPLWITNNIPWASKTIYSRTSNGVYTFIEGMNTIQPQKLSHG